MPLEIRAAALSPSETVLSCARGAWSAMYYSPYVIPAEYHTLCSTRITFCEWQVAVNAMIRPFA